MRPGQRSRYLLNFECWARCIGYGVRSFEQLAAFADLTRARVLAVTLGFLPDQPIGDLQAALPVRSEVSIGGHAVPRAVAHDSPALCRGVDLLLARSRGECW
jgi:hypothetical protein